MIEIDFTFNDRDESIKVHGYLMSCSKITSEDSSVKIGPSRYSKVSNRYLIPIYFGAKNTDLDFRITIPWSQVHNHVLTKKKKKGKH